MNLMRKLADTIRAIASLKSVILEMDVEINGQDDHSLSKVSQILNYNYRLTQR